MRHNRDPGRKGGPNDDVARNIRAQQQRDAMPSPEEARAEARRYLAEKGCVYCGEDDPDQLRQAEPARLPQCRDRQSRRGEPAVICEDGHGTTGERTEAMLQARTNAEGTPIVLYGCGVDRVADPDPREEDVGEGPPNSGPTPHPARRWASLTPRIPVNCMGDRCASPIEQVFYPDEEYEGDSGEVKTEGEKVVDANGTVLKEY